MYVPVFIIIGSLDFECIDDLQKDIIFFINVDSIEVSLFAHVLQKYKIKKMVSYSRSITIAHFQCIYWFILRKTSNEKGLLLNMKANTLKQTKHTVIQINAYDDVHIIRSIYMQTHTYTLRRQTATNNQQSKEVLMLHNQSEDKNIREKRK